jgi:multidrug efflux pump subunit AcrB
MEQIQRTHEEHPEEDSPRLVTKAITYLLPAMIGSSLSTIVIFIPFELMSGVAGAYFKVLTNTMIITLTCSFFVTWVALPVIYLLLSKKKRSAKAKPIQQAHHLKQQRWVHFSFEKPYISFLVILGLALGIYLIFQT